MKSLKSIALVSCINNSSVGKLRTKGYINAISNTQDTIIIEGSEEHIEKELSSLIAKKNIDAIMALDQESSLAAFRIGKKKEVLNDKTIAIIGYANTVISEHLTPSLTTIDQHGKHFGVTTAQLMLKRLENPDDKPESVIINSTVQKRMTS